MLDPKRPIRRSQHDRVLGGVLGGFARWLDWDPSVARVVFVLVTAFTGFALGIVAYVVLWFFLPPEGPAAAPVTPPERPTTP